MNNEYTYEATHNGRPGKVEQVISADNSTSWIFRAPAARFHPSDGSGPVLMEAVEITLTEEEASAAIVASGGIIFGLPTSY